MNIIFIFACISTVFSLECYHGFIKHTTPLIIKEEPENKICRRAQLRNDNEELYHGMYDYPSQSIQNLMEAHPGEEVCTLELEEGQLFRSCYCSSNACNSPFPTDKGYYQN